MNLTLIILVVIILTSIALNKLSSKMGVPVLLLFILLGILLGWNDTSMMEQYGVVETTCSTALIFIIFYGGFGTKWSTARPVIKESAFLATFGVLITAALTGTFCHFALKWGWVESLLMGSVVSSTDAASVFSILRSHKMGLKNNTAPMLEIESGSNDPCSYLLTIVMISLLKGESMGFEIVWKVFAQLAFGGLFGILIAQGTLLLLKRVRLPEGFSSLFFVAVALLSFALPSIVGGNGYLSAYVAGIILGNSDLKDRKTMATFFDGITSLTQIVIFCLLGVMVIPGNLLKAIVPAVLIFAFLTLVGRPVSVFSILVPFKKYSGRQMGFISFVGLRGAASIVFAIMTLNPNVGLENDIFSIVFCIVLISMSLQGSLIPVAAKAFDMMDSSVDVMKTFNDFSEAESVSFGSLSIKERDKWAGKMIKDLMLPSDVQITLILRGEKRIVPKGHTEIKEGDKVIICSRTFSHGGDINLIEHPVSQDSHWIGSTVKDYPKKDNSILVMIKRGSEHIIPNGNTVIKSGDVMFILKQ